MVAFITSVLITALMCGVMLRVARHRPPKSPMTWGEAFVAATFVFAFMLMIYGIVPNQWLLWAGNELGWRSDKMVFPDGVQFFGRGRIMVSYQAIQDAIAALIYVVGLAGQWMGWLWWQKRGRKPAAPQQLPTSAYGRPLVRKV